MAANTEAARRSALKKLDGGTGKLAGIKALWGLYSYDSADGPARVLVYSMNTTGPPMVVACFASEGEFASSEPTFKAALETFRTE
jgi:hypothetical protein